MSGSARTALGWVRALVEDGPDIFCREHGEGALRISQEVEAALMMPLEGHLGHVVLWEQFVQTPGEVFEALVGAVQGYVDRDVGLAAWLDEAVQRYQAAVREQ